MRNLQVRKIKLLKLLVLLVIGIILLSLLAVFIQPSDATRKRYEEMIETGFIDEVKTPEGLGLDYLHHRPHQLTAGLVEAIRGLRDEVGSQLSDDIAVIIPLGTDGPFGVGALRNDDNYGGRNVGYFEEIGYVDESGQPLPVTGGDLVDMFGTEANNGGSFDALKTREMFVTDASGSFLQARRVAVIDLICRNRQTDRYYLLPNVRVDSFCRDALNSVSERTWSRNDVDVRRLRI